jgi:formylmethanofuran dehydrogenase subunit E
MKTLKEVAEFHGHMCPGLTIGYRVSQYALEKMGHRDVDEEIVAIVENDSCAVDAVQVLMGCTFGKGNLIFRDHGKQVYTFINRASGESLRISVNWKAPEESQEEKSAWDKYSKGDHSDEVMKFVHDRKSKKIEHLLRATPEELFEIDTSPVEAPPSAKIYSSIRCSSCGEKTMETRMTMLHGETLCQPCYLKAEVSDE